MTGAGHPTTLHLMRVTSDIDDLAEHHGGAFVPTMGALHEGHLAMIRRARQYPGAVLVSIFVNPTQFSPADDFERYPRQFEADTVAAEQAGADVVFAPDVEMMYPPGQEIRIPPLPRVATEPGLDDAHRAGHLAGVCQVVARLFDLTMPRFAIFGEKDYQQLLVISAMVEAEGDRWPGLEIIAHETIREPDGLAMSSRNAYLDEAQRKRAVGLSQALNAAQTAADPAEAESVMHDILELHDLKIDYAVVRDAITLMPIDDYSQPARVLIAAHLDNVRLIDNMAINIGG